MADLSTTYMGLTLENPIIVSSSGLTSTAEGIARLEKAGAAAVVMKSVFEEQILSEVNSLALVSLDGHPEMQDYINRYQTEYSLGAFLSEVEKAVKAVSIPVIGSVNCVSKSGWEDYVKRFEDTGVAGLELNIFIVPTDMTKSSEDVENNYIEIFQAVHDKLSIPVAVKLSPYITTPLRFVQRLADAGVRTLILFNRALPFDIDIENQTIQPGQVISEPAEMSHSLRMISMIAGRVSCELAASTGIHDAASVVKHLLAGANAVQICSTLYKNSDQYVTSMLKELDAWFDAHSAGSVEAVKGKLSYKNSPRPSVYERVQYLKTYSSYS